ncbi:TMV resistance protein N-like [Bidens hawaiensis]|uniref:TMV resistance protein N-like n=1 Tax=Bidens hawaiensis TaxID=980011 RepID=UPI00404B2B16
MASSSCDQIIPASVSQSWNHDVFLSFRGEDTRKSFVDHLYTALIQQGIQTYKDDETLDRGEAIGPALLKAIQESRIAVITFSKNYADSSWCLDELEHIIECMENKGQIMMPVFYDIDPSDVRKQNGIYEEPFVNHELEHKNKVKSWRKALVKAGSLSGWVLKDFANRHEAKCIKNIVSTISSRLSLPNTNVNKNIIGIEARLQDLKSNLDIGSGGVRMVGIWGVGGGGKTTLASAAYTQISRQFEAHCFVENIRDESSKHGLRRLQEVFLSFILKTKVNLESEIKGKSMIKRRLGHKAVLVVLDDVDDLKQLEALAGSHDWFGEGSRIIITTRDEHLLSRKVDTIYEVSLLSHDEATKLFSRHAYREVKPVEDYEMLSQAVVSYAGGLPLALQVLGSFLYDKDKDEWMSVLDKLKCIPDAKVTERLKISYDGLKSDEKELFLDIACFMRRWEIDDAMRVLIACSFHPVIGVKVLVQKSLIKVSNGIFDMHDLIEEMAHYIVRVEHPNNPEKRSRIWKEEDIVDFYDMRAAEPLMETEVLANLQISYDNRSRLPRVVANMKKLRWVMLSGYPASSFSSKFQPTKLGCMMLVDSKQKQLWKGRKCLPNLKVLSLYRALCLLRTPDFNGLPCLERLILEDCDELKEIHPSIGYHERLVYVKVSMCRKLKMFPPILRMKKLETLKISVCRRLQKFPDIRTSMGNLVNLHLDVTDIEIIPSSVGQFCTNLVSFKFIICKLKRIDGNFHLLKSLKELNLAYCSQHLNPHSTTLKNLMNCKMLQSFHQYNFVSLKFPQFPRFLRMLNLSYCNLGDGDIPSDICELLNLQALYLNGNKFSRLNSSLSGIPCLKFVNLSFCKSLVELPDLPSSIAILNATNCDSIESVGDLSKYKWLWKVSLWRREKLIIGSECVLCSMLQVNAVEDRFMSVQLLHEPLMMSIYSHIKTILIKLQLPHNWYSDFSGFLLCADDCMDRGCSIVIKHEMLPTDSQPIDDYIEEFDKNHESYEYGYVAYVPFGSLKHTSWWDPTFTHTTFQIDGLSNPKVRLVPMKWTKSGDSRQKQNAPTIDEFWDEEYEDRKTFEIKDDPKSSSIQLVIII